jgi:hypothetical protein
MVTLSKVTVMKIPPELVIGGQVRAVQCRAAHVRFGIAGCLRASTVARTLGRVM